MQNEHYIEIEHKAMYVSRNTEVRSCNLCCSGKAMSITYSECVCVYVALVISHAMRMRHIVVYNIFPHFLINGTIFEKQLLKTKCVLIFSTNLSEIFLILRTNERDMKKITYWSSYKVPFNLV
jgi:hypothetical protein